MSQRKELQRMTIHNTCVTKCMYASNRKYRDQRKKILEKNGR